MTNINFINMETEEELTIRGEAKTLPQRYFQVRPGGKASRQKLANFLGKASPQDVRVLLGKQVYRLHPDIIF